MTLKTFFINCLSRYVIGIVFGIATDIVALPDWFKLVAIVSAIVANFFFSLDAGRKEQVVMRRVVSLENARRPFVPNTTDYMIAGAYSLILALGIMTIIY